MSREAVEKAAEAVFHLFLNSPEFQPPEFQTLYTAWYAAKSAYDDYGYYDRKLEADYTHAETALSEYCKDYAKTHGLVPEEKSTVPAQSTVKRSAPESGVGWKSLLLLASTVNAAAAKPLVDKVFPSNSENITGGTGVGNALPNVPKVVSASAKDEQKPTTVPTKNSPPTQNDLLKAQRELHTLLRSTYKRSKNGFATSTIVSDEHTHTLRSIDFSMRDLTVLEWSAQHGKYDEFKDKFKKTPDLVKELEALAPTHAGASLVLATHLMLSGEDYERAIIFYAQAYLRTPKVMDDVHSMHTLIAFMKCLVARMEELSKYYSTNPNDAAKHKKANRRRTRLRRFASLFNEYLKDKYERWPFVLVELTAMNIESTLRRMQSFEVHEQLLTQKPTTSPLTADEKSVSATPEPSLKKSITDFRKAYLKFYKGNSAAVITSDVVSTESKDNGMLMKQAEDFLRHYSNDIQEGKRKYPELIASLEEQAPYSAGASFMLGVIHALGGGDSDVAVMLYVQAYLKLTSLFEGQDNYSSAEGFLGAVTLRIKAASNTLESIKTEEDFFLEKNVLALNEMRVLADLAKALHQNLKTYGNSFNTQTVVLAEKMVGVVKVWETAAHVAQEKLAKQKHADVKQPKVVQRRLDTLKGNASAQDEIVHIETAMKAVREYQDHAKNPKKVSEKSKSESKSKPLQEDVDWVLSTIAKKGQEKEYAARLGLDFTLKSFTVLQFGDWWVLNTALRMSDPQKDIITIRDYAFKGNEDALKYLCHAAMRENRFGDAAAIGLQLVRLELTEENYIYLTNAITAILDKEYPKAVEMVKDWDKFDPNYYDQVLHWFEIFQRAIQYIPFAPKNVMDRWLDLVSRAALVKMGVQVSPKPASQADYTRYRDALASASPGKPLIEIHMEWASKGVVDASLALIDLYRKGYEVSQSFVQARLFYRIALIQAGDDKDKRKQVEEKRPLIEERTAESPVNWLIARVTGIEERALPRGVSAFVITGILFALISTIVSLYSRMSRIFGQQPVGGQAAPNATNQPPRARPVERVIDPAVEAEKNAKRAHLKNLEILKDLRERIINVRNKRDTLLRKPEKEHFDHEKIFIKKCEPVLIEGDALLVKTYPFEKANTLEEDLNIFKKCCKTLEGFVSECEAAEQLRLKRIAEAEQLTLRHASVLSVLDNIKSNVVAVAAVPDCIAAKKTTVVEEQKKLQSDKESSAKAKDWVRVKEVEKEIGKLDKEIAALDEQSRKYKTFVQRCENTTAEKYPAAEVNALENVVKDLKKTFSELEKIVQENQASLQASVLAEKDAHTKQQATLYAERQTLLEEFKKKFAKSTALAQKYIQDASAQLDEMRNEDLPVEAFQAFEIVCNNLSESCIELIALLTQSHEEMSNDEFRAYIDSCAVVDAVLDPEHPEQIAVTRQYAELHVILANEARIAEARRRAEKELNNNNNDVPRVVTDAEIGTEKRLVRMDSVKTIKMDFPRELTAAEVVRKQRAEEHERDIGWMERPVNQLLLKLAESVNDTSLDYKFFPLVGKYSLLYRLHELQLFLLTAFHYHHRDKTLEQDPVLIPLLFQANAVGEFATEFWNLLMHSFDKVTREELLACVKAAYCVETGRKFKIKLVCDPKMIDEGVKTVVCASALYKTLTLDKQAKPHQTVMELLDTLETVFKDLMELEKFSSKDNGNKLLPHYQEACRMVIMIMGEIDQRIRFVEQGEALLGNTLFKGNVAKFLENCHKVVRNPLRHGRTEAEYQELQRLEQLMKDVKNSKNENNYSQLREKMDEAARLQEIIYRRFKDTHEDAKAGRSVCMDVMGIDEVFALVDTGRKIFRDNSKLFEHIRGTMNKWLKKQEKTNAGKKPSAVESKRRAGKK